MIDHTADVLLKFKRERERLLRKCTISGQCWLWTGAKRGRYGVVRVNGSIRNAHRAAYALFIGPVDDGVSVLHSCGRGLCCNPQHLYLEVQEVFLNAEQVVA